MVGRFIKVANLILDQGGHVSFEWPRYCAGWTEEPLASWISSRHSLDVSLNTFIDILPDFWSHKRYETHGVYQRIANESPGRSQI